MNDRKKYEANDYKDAPPLVKYIIWLDLHGWNHKRFIFLAILAVVISVSVPYVWDRYVVNKPVSLTIPLKVVDVVSNEPVEGAEVVFMGRYDTANVVTDHQGNAIITFIASPTSVANVTVTAEEYETGRSDWQFDPNGPASMDYALARIVPQAVPTVAPQHDPSRYAITMRAAISGHNRQRISNVTPDDCKRFCDQATEFVCRSFDYHVNDRWCDLSDASAANVGLRTNYRGHPYDHYAGD